MRELYKYSTGLVFAISLTVSSTVAQESAYRIEKLPFNTSISNEMAPVILKDGIIFCSDRKISIVNDKKSFAGDRMYNLYFAKKIDSVKWEMAKRIKTEGSNLSLFGPVSLTADGKGVWFTSTVVTGRAAKRKRLKSNPLGIYYGELLDNRIINVKPFSYNSREHNLAQPSVSPDGRFLFFSSDMAGGAGKSDLYYSELKNGDWREPVSLGLNVNTKYSENYPFMHPSGKLYFSSNRPATAPYMGGIDVYYTSLNNGVWDVPVPMPEPVNSKSDDFAFVAEGSFQQGYFTRSDGRSDDVYKYISLIVRKTECAEGTEDSYCYEFYEENALKFDTIPFKYKWNFGDGNSDEGIKLVYCYSKPGVYRVSLDVTNLLTKVTKKEERWFELEVTRTEQPVITSADKCLAGQEIKLSGADTYLPGWTIARYYWNFDDMTIALGQDVTKKYNQPGVYSVQLIVTSAPDEQGVVRETCVSKNITVTRQP